jgi:hypothetical protein
MENTPTGCGSDLPTILRILKNDRKSRSVHNFLQPLDSDPNRIKDFCLPAKAPPSQDWCKCVPSGSLEVSSNMTRLSFEVCFASIPQVSCTALGAGGSSHSVQILAQGLGIISRQGKITSRASSACHDSVAAGSFCLLFLFFIIK